MAGINLRVKKNSSDAEKDKYTLSMKGSADLGLSTMVDVELKLEGKEEELLERFPMHSLFNIKLEAGEK